MKTEGGGNECDTIPMGCCIHIVGFGDAGCAVTGHMNATSNLAGIQVLHLRAGEHRWNKQILESDMLFMVLDPFIDNDAKHAVALATLAKKERILTFAIGYIQKPIASDGDGQWRALETLKDSVDALFIVATEQSPHSCAEESKEQIGSRMNVGCQTIVHSITDLFAHRGMIAIDFADIRTIFEDSGFAAIGVGHGWGGAAGPDAAASAIDSLIRRGIDVAKVRGALVTIAAHPQYFSLNLFSDAMDVCDAALADDCNLVAGSYLDSTRLDDKVSVYLLATGLGRELAVLPIPRT